MKRLVRVSFSLRYPGALCYLGNSERSSMALVCISFISRIAAFADFAFSYPFKTASKSASLLLNHDFSNSDGYFLFSSWPDI